MNLGQIAGRQNDDPPGLGDLFTGGPLLQSHDAEAVHWGEQGHVPWREQRFGKRDHDRTPHLFGFPLLCPHRAEGQSPFQQRQGFFRLAGQGHAVRIWWLGIPAAQGCGDGIGRIGREAEPAAKVGTHGGEGEAEAFREVVENLERVLPQCGTQKLL